jgi:hypothetical protein
MEGTLRVRMKWGNTVAISISYNIVSDECYAQLPKPFANVEAG